MTYQSTTGPPGRSQPPGGGTTPGSGTPVIRAAPPPGGARWRADEHEDLFHVFIVGSGGVQDVDTKFGLSKVVHCDHIIRWDEDGKPERWDSQPVFGAVMTGQLQAGGVVAGNVGKGTAQPGRNAPWMILEATPEQLDWVRSEWGNLHDQNGQINVPLAKESDRPPGEPF